MNLRRALVGWVLYAAASVAWAQLSKPLGPTAAPSVTIPRSVALADQAAQVRDWVYYQSMRELPSDMREIVARLVRETMVRVGESLDESDVIAEPANAQLQFAAVGGDLMVLVFYANGGIVAPRMHMFIFDQVGGDACRYVFSRGVSRGGLQMEYLLQSIRESGGDRVVRVDYVESDALKRP